MLSIGGSMRVLKSMSAPPCSFSMRDPTAWPVDLMPGVLEGELVYEGVEVE